VALNLILSSNPPFPTLSLPKTTTKDVKTAAAMTAPLDGNVLLFVFIFIDASWPSRNASESDSFSFPGDGFNNKTSSPLVCSAVVGVFKGDETKGKSA
jgi:hypothetical protein